jgi:hypothetical protein
MFQRTPLSKIKQKSAKFCKKFRHFFFKKIIMSNLKKTNNSCHSFLCWKNSSAIVKKDEGFSPTGNVLQQEPFAIMFIFKKHWQTFLPGGISIFVSGLSGI